MNKWYKLKFISLLCNINFMIYGGDLDECKKSSFYWINLIKIKLNIYNLTWIGVCLLLKIYLINFGYKFIYLF